MATALETLAGTKSLGNVRALTSQARKDSATGADASKQLQEQLDKMLGMTRDAVSELVALIPPAPSSIGNFQAEILE